MTIQEITQLVALFDGSTAQSMKLHQQEFSLELSRGQDISATVQTPTAITTKVEQPADHTPLVVKAPLVGTYYCAPAPDAETYIKVGQQVKKGEVLCLIEAMKMMSEIPAPCDCIIDRILQEDGALLAFDAPILEYTPC